ncbi:unnamed protein product [Arctia plantaginis]|uniref:Pheromone binding protein 2 n=1 Tax=Arctia plantaginis TaxID=874455 RepID=A0A8S1AGK4_ARCPL|nr:unnamed protein product [Arctia plantaginis]CAB3244427.1 unnamed protein product [Arctia plantaginis]
MSVRLAILVVVCLTIRVDSSQEVMKQMSINFGKPLEACRKEMDIPETVMQDFYNFWKEGYELKNRDMGCAILCVTAKLELLDSDLNLHRGNAQDFARKHGADDAMAKQLVDIIHNCAATSPEAPDDPCQKTLNTAICFKAEIHKLNWAPSIDLVVGEMLAEA